MTDPLTPPHPTSPDLAGAAPYITAPHEAPPHTTVPHEVPRETTVHQAMAEPVVIAEENSITLDAALELAAAEHYPIAKSTLQRRAKHWREQGTAAPVKAVLIVLPSIGATYRIDREDFAAYIFDQKNNMRVLTPDQPTQPAPAPLVQPAAAPAGEPAGLPSTKYVERLETDIAFLRSQVETKDKQIDNLTRLSESTINNVAQQNILIQGFQRMLGLAGPAARPGEPRPGEGGPRDPDATLH